MGLKNTELDLYFIMDFTSKHRDNKQLETMSDGKTRVQFIWNFSKFTVLYHMLYENNKLRFDGHAAPRKQ